MPSTSSDTICAVATPPGRSGVGIVRISGPGVLEACKKILGFEPTPRFAHYCDFLTDDSRVIDQGIALYFENPNSFTGEDVLELQGHGGTQVITELLERVLTLGFRLADPGEFSERAFLNNKIDLVQAEAIADLIDASSQQAARSAIRTLKGEFSRCIHDLVSKVTAIRVNVEAAIDFSDEDIDVLSDTGVATSIDEILQDLNEVYRQAQQGVLLKEGMTVVIAGKPNAGKSSLLNALAGIESAIVTDIPGTTRDLLKEEISIDGMPVHIIDTAGLRSSDDVVEQEGVRRARQAMADADQILLLVDATEHGDELDMENLLLPLAELQDGTLDGLLTRTTIVFNKTDLTKKSPGIESTNYQDLALKVIHISAKEKSGLDNLREHLKSCIGFQATEEGAFVARERHILALKNAEKSLISAANNISEYSPLELAAEDLRLVQQELGSITGDVSSDDLLGEIFSSFCVGK